MRYNYRCGKDGCRKRITLTHKLEWYIRPPKCKGACRGEGNLNHDPEVARRHQREKCECGGIYYPHRRGTVLNENEFCRAIPIERVELLLLRRENIEPDGPFSYLETDHFNARKLWQEE